MGSSDDGSGTAVRAKDDAVARNEENKPTAKAGETAAATATAMITDDITKSVAGPVNEYVGNVPHGAPTDHSKSSYNETAEAEAVKSFATQANVDFGGSCARSLTSGADSGFLPSRRCGGIPTTSVSHSTAPESGLGLTMPSEAPPRVEGEESINRNCAGGRDTANVQVARRNSNTAGKTTKEARDTASPHSKNAGPKYVGEKKEDGVVELLKSAATHTVDCLIFIRWCVGEAVR